ncbi:MAG: hypothetical protein Q8P90_02375, partial [bacterium]|nr:hypothetical protein [bacterium]
MMKSRQIRMVLTVVLAVLVVVPLTTQVVEAKRFTKVNVANYIFNKSGRLKVKDKLLVTKSAVFNTAVNVKGQLKNTDSGEALKVDDDLYVTGDTTIDGTLTGTVWDVKGQLKNTDSGEALKVDDDLYVTGDTTIDGAITSAVW